MRFAENTDVPVERSKAEIERLLVRYGASRFMSGWGAHAATIMFHMQKRYVRFVLPLPAKEDARFARTPGGRRVRDEADRYRAWEQECRSAWRALCLAIKGKLEACERGITTFEHEFLAHIVMPDDKTVGEHMTPLIARAYDSGRMPRLALPDFTDGREAE